MQPIGPTPEAGFGWLSVITFAPLAGAVLLAFVPGRATGAHRTLALVTTVVTFLLSLGMLAAYEPEPGFQLVDRATWVGVLNFQYILGVDGISLWLVLLTTFLMPAAILVSWRLEHQTKYFMVSFLVLETAMLGSFLALDLLLFFLFFEALLFPMYLIIGTWGSERRVYAAVKFFLFTMAGSAFLFVGILFLYFRAGSELGGATFAITELSQLQLPVATARWLFLAFFVAFAVKVPLFPLHTWLPDAHTEAPTAGSLILAAVLLKVGAYGLIRFNLSLFPEASEYFKDFVSILALIGIVYGAVVALIQTDVKRLVAYSSVSHLGFVVLGTFAFTLQGLSGGVLQMVNHGLSTGALFLLVGMLYERLHTRELTRMGGLGATMPVLAGLFLFVALSSIGLPGLNGFVGEFLILVGTFTVNKAYAAIAVTGVVLAAIYLLWAYQRAFHGAPAIAGGAGDLGLSPTGGDGKAGRLLDLNLREHLVLAPILAAILVIGVYPNALLKNIEPSTAQLGSCVAEQETGRSGTTRLGCVPTRGALASGGGS
ncbi:MAG TPA: NADH-quinone oxidoreductase subunit M [Actinomycetota bacterium]|nr:NADH-quinone oxidoreductase subunit M [Actinomycetota bacterium]